MEVVNLKKDSLIIANKKFNSRLIVGTGKYKSMSECAKAIKLSGAEIVTVAVRRVNISDKNKPLLMDYICLLYTSPSPRDVEESRMPSSA